jgi:hypothetical protein
LPEFKLPLVKNGIHPMKYFSSTSTIIWFLKLNHSIFKRKACQSFCNNVRILKNALSSLVSLNYRTSRSTQIPFTSHAMQKRQLLKFMLFHWAVSKQSVGITRLRASLRVRCYANNFNLTGLCVLFLRIENHYTTDVKCNCGKAGFFTELHNKRSR